MIGWHLHLAQFGWDLRWRTGISSDMSTMVVSLMNPSFIKFDVFKIQKKICHGNIAFHILYVIYSMWYTVYHIHYSDMWKFKIPKMTFDSTYELRGINLEKMYFKTSPRKFVKIVDFGNFRVVIVAWIYQNWTNSIGPV